MPTRTAEMTASVSLSAPLAPAPGRLSLTVNLRQVTKIVAVVIALLIVTGTAANIVSNHVAPSHEHKLAKVMHRFDIGFEPSIPNWYSSVALLASSILLAVIARAARRADNPWFYHWLGLAGLFLLLSLDEAVQFHEMVNTAMAELFGRGGLLYFPWVVPALLFAAVVGFSYLPFLARLDRRTAVLFVFAGAIYVIGAAGMEMVGGALVDQHGEESIQHSFAQCFEELFEMLGVMLFLYTLLDYIQRHIGCIQISIR